MTKTMTIKTLAAQIPKRERWRGIEATAITSLATLIAILVDTFGKSISPVGPELYLVLMVLPLCSSASAPWRQTLLLVCSAVALTSLGLNGVFADNGVMRIKVACWIATAFFFFARSIQTEARIEAMEAELLKK